ncbi:glycine/sarcosine/betaine reductase component B subunit [Desulfogranum marinum]|uniref:glycine/sarcosine/betaine reductase component B subunit n=1 Tax=Desulfogranum marinum TaxID=453220 RepID=UPI0029C7ADC4|nr:glycine/sarcosine/betaine reductase component B subunit [Desulfogranum marinum]
MTLKLAYFEINDIVFGQETIIDGSTLVINRESLKNTLKTADKRISAIGVHTAMPGDSTRILCVKDVIEPRCKINGTELGVGNTHILKNVAVVTCGKIVGFQEGIIDMSGPGAAHTPFSATLNVVLDIQVVPGLSPHEHEEVVRLTGLTAATLLAQTSTNKNPTLVETYPPIDPAAVPSSLPRIAYVYMLLSQGLLHDTYVLEENAKQGLPRILEHTLLLDGAIISGNCVSACDKNTTYHHQNNPVLRELLREHHKRLSLVGVVLTNEPISLDAKKKSAQQSVELVQTLKADGAIMSKEGFGNPDTDQMLLIRGLEEAGIPTVALTDEFAGANGCSQSLADSTPQAIAMVSVGNANERILLPPLEQLLGPISDLTKLAGAYPHSLHDDGSLEVELQAIIGATNELGWQTLRCREV